jgi:PKD repeat protein
MWTKTKKIILTIELVVLIILSVFVASILASNAENKPPIASASADVTSGKVPLSVTFKGSGLDSDGTVVSYRWDFGDGTTSKSQNPTHIYQKSGKFIVTLTVTDNNRVIGRNNIIIYAQENINPTVTPTAQQESSSDYVFTDFTWSPEYPDVGEKITFRYTYYYYSSGEITLKHWDFGDGSSGWGSVVSHTYNKKGEYTITLSVTGRDFSSGELTTGYSIKYITIGASPFPRFTWSPEEPTIGEKVNFDASESEDTNGQIVKYNWSYTDASEPNKVIEMGNNKTLTYMWKKQGNYKVKLAVTDDDNNTNEITKNIVVSILKIEKVTGGFRHVVLQITNRGNIAAENIQWKVYVNRNLLIIPLWKIFTKTGTINTLKPGESTSVDIGRYRRGFGRITITITVEASNAVKITESLQGFMFNKYVHLRS